MNSRYRIGELVVDCDSRTVTNNGRDIGLTWMEFDLLWYLAANSGRVVSRDELFEKFLGIEYNGLDRTIDVRVSRLRKKLEINSDLPPVIQSVRSEGYCMAVNPSPGEIGKD
jgi:two-component system response regulator RstA